MSTPPKTPTPPRPDPVECTPNPPRATAKVRSKDPGYLATEAKLLANSRGTVFASVASYRDPDTIPTLKSMLADPGANVRVAVIWQGDPATADEIRALDDRIDLLALRPEDARGCSWPRAVAQTMYRGEDYFAQFDAHMRFEPGWAATLIDQFRHVPERSILTSYCVSLDQDSTKLACIMNVNGWCDHGLSWSPSLWTLDSFPGHKPIPARGISGHMLIAPGQWVEEIPWDPQYYFTGEELAPHIRSWMHGWSTWHPARNPVRHRYGRPAPTHWADDPKWGEMHHHAKLRLEALLGISGKASELGVYGPGPRPIREWEEWAGVNIKERTYIPDAEWRARIGRVPRSV